MSSVRYFLSRGLFGEQQASTTPAPTRGNRATIPINVVGENGRVETVGVGIQTVIGQSKEKNQHESKVEADWRQGSIVLQIDIPESVWERLESSPRHCRLFPHLRSSLEGYKRNKVAFDEFLAVLDMIQGDQGI